MNLRHRLHLLRPRYMKIRAKRVVCLVRGHRYGDIATRMLGVCDRCHFPFDGPDPDCGTPMCRCTLDHMRCKPEKPCAGKGSNVCVAEGCFGEACVHGAVTE